ncbi:MAG: hypothetical protein JNJ61_03230 [Anaerolineae bacterium]|nr:hypothetical protein [Anaerolineae bacterium]
MTTTWTIAVDWDRNGDYTGTYDNVTSRVISANWFLGGRMPDGSFQDFDVAWAATQNADTVRNYFDGLMRDLFKS